MSTPGSVGRPGKWPAKKGSSPVSLQMPLADDDSTISTTSSTNRKGARWGRTSAGRGSPLSISVSHPEAAVHRNDRSRDVPRFVRREERDRRRHLRRRGHPLQRHLLEDLLLPRLWQCV